MELALRARSMEFRRSSGSPGRCSRCGRPVTRQEDWLRLGGALVVHPDCLYSES